MIYDALIFSHSITPRLQYVVDFLKGYYGLSFRVVSDEDKYRTAPETCKINYGYHRIAKGEIFIHSHVLLFESSVRQVKIECFQKEMHNGKVSVAFFKTEGDVEFDLFAGVFYLITRYEEYLPHKTDMFGRFPYESALAFKENFLHLPLVNIWLEDFRFLLAQKNSKFQISNFKFRFLPTYDIDMAWSFQNKGMQRNAAALMKLLMKFKFRQLIHRIKVLRRKTADPYDAYEWMDRLHEKYQLHPMYFFLMAIEKGKYDKNTDVENPEFRELIRSIAGKYEIAIHPSWASGDHHALLAREKQLLENISGKHIHSSRQHFIRFHFPHTYQRLLSVGITEEHSMGYGSINGFRASVASSFYWYDLKSEASTKLLIHPFCFMDANAFYEQKLSPAAALEEMLQYYEVIRS
ncbi:MAG: DUF7033 domain-containing protein, partial [Flavisolibacter sp.]